MNILQNLHNKKLQRTDQSVTHFAVAKLEPLGYSITGVRYKLNRDHVVRHLVLSLAVPKIREHENNEERCTE